MVYSLKIKAFTKVLTRGRFNKGKELYAFY